MPHGGYRKLKTFQIARLVYDLTVRFCDRFVNPRSRTHDQMVQAARSGVQNIAEGSEAAGTSKKFELKLTNVARASLEELLLDYEDFLRQRNLSLWQRSDPRRNALVAARCQTVEEIVRWAQDLHKKDSSPYPEIAANAAHALICVATVLLKRQLQSQSKQFQEEGGFTERLYQERKQRRKKVD